MINYEMIVSNLMNNQNRISNPTLANAVQLFKNKDSKALNSLMQNVCKEYGINPQQFIK